MPAGIIPVETLLSSSPYLKHVIFVVEETSKQMDWKHNTPGDRHFATWHDVIEQRSGSVTSDPPEVSGYELPGVISIWESGVTKGFEIIEYTQKVSSKRLKISSVY